MANPPIRIEVFGRPAQQGSKRGFVHRGRVILVETNAKRQRQWYGNVASAAADVMKGRSLLSGPVQLSICFRFARPRAHYGTGKNSSVVKPAAPLFHTQTPDLSKLVRCTEDALTGVVWQDDRQVIQYANITRVWTESSEGAVVTIQEMPTP